MDNDDIRDELLRAAAEVFAESGYSGARVQQIAERAGLTTGAIYNRFSGKSELLLDAMDHQTSALLDDLSAADMSTLDVLESIGLSLIDDETAQTSALVLEAFIAARREDDVAERLRPQLADDHARLAKLVDADKSSGAIDAAWDTEAVVTFCQSVAVGMHMMSAIEVHLPDPKAWRQLVACLLEVMTRPPTAPLDQD